MSQTRIPSDIDREDKIMAGLSARQLLIVVLPLAALWTIYMPLRSVVPVFAIIPLGVLVGAVAFTLAVGERDGLSLDRFALTGIRHHRANKQLIPDASNAASSLGLPVEGISDDGVLDLGSDGSAIICQASSVSFMLLAEREQEAAANAFGRFCNALDGEVQILVRSARVQLDAAIAELRKTAPGLPHLKLEVAALSHATFLDHVASRSDLWTRQLFMVIRSNAHASDSGPILHRRVEETASLLRSAGVMLTALDAENVESLLRQSADPDALPVVGSSLYLDLVMGKHIQNDGL